MASVREIIREAVTRINLTPRKQAISGDILESAFKLLQGIVAKYNSDNLLNFTQNSVIAKNTEVTHIYDETDFVAGKNNLYFDSVDALNAYDITAEDYANKVWAMVKSDINTVYTINHPIANVYQWQSHATNETQRAQQMQEYCKMNHVCVRDVAKINSVFLVTQTELPYKIYKELDFVPANKFDSYLNAAPVYTVIEKSEGEWIIKVKPGIAMLNRRLKINYNEAIEFDVDSDLYIPDNYTELLIVALAHKLALQFPRLDDAHMQRLENEVRVLVDNVRTPKAITRQIVRSDYFDNDYHTATPSELLTGVWF